MGGSSSHDIWVKKLGNMLVRWLATNRGLLLPFLGLGPGHGRVDNQPKQVTARVLHQAASRFGLVGPGMNGFHGLAAVGFHGLAGCAIAFVGICSTAQQITVQLL